VLTVHINTLKSIWGGEKMKKIEEFVMDYPIKRTQDNYRSQLNNYFKSLKIKDVNKYFDSGRDYKADVETYWHSMNGKPLLTIKTSMSIVKSFLEFNEIDIPNKTWKSLRRKTKGNRARTMDKAPTNSELKKILQHGSVLEKSIFLMGSSSGMRIDEIMHLTIDDIDLDSNPVRVNVPVSQDQDTKTGNPRFCFISKEAKDALTEWLKERPEYLRVAVEKSKNKKYKGKPIFVKTIDDQRIFPMGYHNARKKWVRLLEKTGKPFNQKDKSTGRYVYHIHVLRKFFLSRSKLSIPETIAEALAGHEAYLAEAYRRYTPEQLAAFYKKGVRNLLVFETTSDENIKRLDGELKEKEIQIKDLQDKMEKMEYLMDQKAHLLKLLEMQVEQEKIKNKLNSR